MSTVGKRYKKGMSFIKHSVVNSGQQRTTAKERLKRQTIDDKKAGSKLPFAPALSGAQMSTVITADISYAQPAP
ncbi:MAG: hypothetical protein ACRDCM_02675, partial [Plesiomonas shigelloides]